MRKMGIAALKITAIPQALAQVDLTGAIVTIDVMETQTAIAKQIVDGQGDYVLALKGNQGTLFDAATEYLQQQSQSDFRNCRERRLETTETGHGRTENRT
jgi:predicted transposase YbfD/YdcC